MPLILMTGLPSSGKTTRCRQIAKYFEDTHGKKVHVVSEENFYQQSNTDKNKLAFGKCRQFTVKPQGK
jgi:tRNA uridine 5-carbamoylmethylation protein Kti12